MTGLTPSLSESEISNTTRDLEKQLVPFMKRFPGNAGERQPVHTVYGGAHLFKSDTTRKLGEVAIRFLDEYGRDGETFTRAIGTGEAFADLIWMRVVDKLTREPVEDF